jgi:hypothetical protein
MQPCSPIHPSSPPSSSTSTSPRDPRHCRPRAYRPNASSPSSSSIRPPPSTPPSPTPSPNSTSTSPCPTTSSPEALIPAGRGIHRPRPSPPIRASRRPSPAYRPPPSSQPASIRGALPHATPLGCPTLPSFLTSCHESPFESPIPRVAKMEERGRGGEVTERNSISSVRMEACMPSRYAWVIRRLCCSHFGDGPASHMGIK